MKDRNQEHNKMSDNCCGLYVHVPFCLSKCGYCAFYSVIPDGQLIESFLDRLEHEAEKRLKEQPARFSTVFIGGGNPTALGKDGLKRLVSIILRYIEPHLISEWTFETNPETLNADAADLLEGLPGIRLSIGIQRLRPAELAILGRRARLDAIYSALEIAFSRIDNIGADFILGVPGCDDIADDVRCLLARFPLQHVSAYFLTIEENTPLHLAVTSETMASPEDIGPEELFSLRNMLVSQGFEHYEISNYARPGRRCLHNMNYWAPAGYIGLGPSAVSTEGSVRTSNISSLSAWLNGDQPLVENLSAIDLRNEYTMLRLRLLSDGLDLSLLEDKYGRQSSPFYRELNKHIVAGNLASIGTVVRLTSSGLVIADEVMADLFI